MIKMIYESISHEKPIRQGDIFQNIPVPYITDINKLKTLGQNELIEQNWLEISNENTLYNVLTVIEKCFAIVISQDCDCVRNPDLSLFRIEICSRLKNKTSPKSIFKEILKINNNTNSLMYLPEDEKGFFPNKMQINFSSIISIKRENLEKMRHLRIFRLNNESLIHFRTKIQNFFLRYSYTESYPMNTKEFKEYKKYRIKRNPEEELDPRYYQDIAKNNST